MKANLSTSSSKAGMKANNLYKQLGKLRPLILFVCSFAVVFWVINAFVFLSFSQRQDGGRLQWWQALEAGAAEAVVIGSSNAQYAYNPLILTEATGLETYSLASAGQALDSSYYLLQDFLSTQEGVELVYLDIYWRVLQSAVDESQLFRNYEKIQAAPVKKSFFKGGFPLASKIGFNIPVLRYRQDIHSYTEASIEAVLSGDAIPSTGFSFSNLSGLFGAARKPQGAEPMPEYRGHSRTSSVVTLKVAEDENKFRYAFYKPMQQRQLDYLGRIVELCENRGIKLVVASAPVLSDSLAFTPYYSQINAELAGYLQTLDVHYLDFNLRSEADAFRQRQYFKDENHMNSAGADAFSVVLGELVVIKYRYIK